MKVLKTIQQRFVGAQSICDNCGYVLEIDRVEDIVRVERYKGIMTPPYRLAICMCPHCNADVPFDEREDDPEVAYA